ncbi:MAG: glycosyltransferase family 2 protein [Lachnospiraceae bacterium]|nr:glycosyltransferase family 2 protein [Lachnospiraceae bacterium]
MNENINHTFVICAYKESPYIEECIKSLKNQSKQSEILVATSTPCIFLKKICEKYNIEYCVREGQSNIADDWNFAYSQAKTPYVTIAHQDDLYRKEYAKQVIEALMQHNNILIACTDYSEKKGETESIGGINLYIKRFLLVPLRNDKKNDKKWRKRFAIRFGNAICCPSVTYNKQLIESLIKDQGRDNLFRKHFRSNLDWEVWEWLSTNPGRFKFIPKVLMSHRIHEGSETTATIKDNERSHEDYEMFCRFWPSWVAKLITGVYANSEKGNELPS